jgi:predicted amidohydrolase YtcJ
MSGVVAGAENGADVRPGPGVQDPAELVIRNAKVHTGDRRRPAASAVAITSGVFTAIGDKSAVAGRTGPGTRVVDALGRRVIPGLNDSRRCRWSM